MFLIMNLEVFDIIRFYYINNRLQNPSLSITLTLYQLFLTISENYMCVHTYQALSRSEL